MIYSTRELYRTIRELYRTIRELLTLFVICCWYAIVVAWWMLKLTARFAWALCLGARALVSLDTPVSAVTGDA